MDSKASPRRWRVALGLAFCLGTLSTATQTVVSTESTKPGASALTEVFAPEEIERPSNFQWAPGAAHLGFTWKDEEKASLWLLDPRSGETENVWRPDEGVDSFVWSLSGGAIAALSDGNLFLWEQGSEEGFRALSASEEETTDPKFSPDGLHVAFARGGNLHLVDVGSGQETPITTDGDGETVLNGTTAWVYWEEIWGREPQAFWWSPDSTSIAFYRFDESAVGIYPLVDESSPYPELREQRYPKAGTTNPEVRVGVYSLDDGTVQWLDTAESEETYLARVDWLPGSDGVAVQRLTREQSRLDLLVCSPSDGRCSLLAREEHPTWINLHNDLRFGSDGEGYLWSDEQTGHRRLLWIPLNEEREPGELVDLTPPGWTVDHLAHWDPDTRSVVYSAYRAGELGAAERQIFHAVVGEAPEQWTQEPGWHEVVAAEGDLWVHRWSTANTPPRVTLRRGAEVLDIALPGPDSSPPPYPDLAFRFLEIPGPEGTNLPAVLLEPRGIEERGDRRFPVVMYHYGGPASQVVQDAWRGVRSRWHLWMADRGYGVLLVDNPASTFFGKAGEDRLHRRFGKLELEAQRAGAEYLRSLDWVDGERLGLWGWSGGGANTLTSLFRSPGTWQAGVAGAPVTDWFLYDTIWTERYLDHPDDNSEGYELSSPLSVADHLEDALLLVHGTDDDNVHPQNTMVLADRLTELGKPFEISIHPGQKHGFRGNDRQLFYDRMTDFFDRHLAPAQ